MYVLVSDAGQLKLSLRAGGGILTINGENFNIAYM